jgi:purine nucleosidase
MIPRAYLLRPHLFAGRHVNVCVETESRLTLGMTAVDWWGVTVRPANVQFMTEVDAAGLHELLNREARRLALGTA